jgi:hypothetical protein
MRAVLMVICVWGFAAGPALAQTPVPAEAYDRLRQADTNRDGFITRQEFTQYRAEQFSRLDRTGDGALTAADRPPAAFRFGVDHAALLDSFDANGDERVTRSEFASAPTPAFDAADRNGDHVLTQAELQTARDARRAAGRP